MTLTLATLLFALVLGAVAMYFLGERILRHRGRRRPTPQGDPLDLAVMFPLRAVQARPPSPYPGETAEEVRVRTGWSPMRTDGTQRCVIPPTWVWSDNRRAWVAPVASPLPPGTRVSPLPGELADAYQLRREGLGVFLPQAGIPGEWAWCKEAERFGPGYDLPHDCAACDAAAKGEAEATDRATGLPS